MNGRMGVSVGESKAFYYQRMTVPQEGSLIKCHWPSVTESSAFVEKKLIGSYLPGDEIWSLTMLEQSLYHCATQPSHNLRPDWNLNKKDII